MNLQKFIARQLAHPTGLGGKVVFSVMTRQNRPLYEEVLRVLSPKDGDKILDVGCGNGIALGMLAKKIHGHFVGIDISQSAVRDAMRRNKALVKSGRMYIAMGDAAKICFADSVFDRVYSINTVYFWDKLDAPLREIHRVLAPGGVFVNAVYSNEFLAGFPHVQYGYNLRTPQELVAAGKAAGFGVRATPILKGKAICFEYTKEV